MTKAVARFSDIGIKKGRFYYSIYLIDINTVDINKTLLFNILSFGEKNLKCFIE